MTQAIEQIKESFPGGAKTATVGQIAAEATKIAASLGKPELSARRVGGILRSSFGLKPRKTRGGFVVDLPVNIGGEHVNVVPGVGVTR